MLPSIMEIIKTSLAWNLTLRDKFASAESKELYPGSSFTACVHDVGIGKTDICVGNFWVTAERLALTDFAQPFSEDRRACLPSSILSLASTLPCFGPANPSSSDLIPPRQQEQVVSGCTPRAAARQPRHTSRAALYALLPRAVADDRALLNLHHHHHDDGGWRGACRAGHAPGLSLLHGRLSHLAFHIQRRPAEQPAEHPCSVVSARLRDVCPDQHHDVHGESCYHPCTIRAEMSLLPCSSVIPSPHARICLVIVGQTYIHSPWSACIGTNAEHYIACTISRTMVLATTQEAPPEPPDDTR